MKLITRYRWILMMTIGFACGMNYPCIGQTHPQIRVHELPSDQYQALQLYRMLGDSELKPYPPEKMYRDFPEVWDWREMAGVTPVKNQGQCGSCWAFAALGVLEAQIRIQTGVEYDLSEQQLVDCTPGSYGCNGGTTESAWSYLAWDPARIEADYPYEAVNGSCRTESSPAYIRTIGFDAYHGSEEAIKSALVDYGPVATSMGANDNLKAYTGGCYADDSNTSINHGVVIVGWDDTICDGGSWIVKNSWGTDFGENGYFTIRRGDVHIGEYFSTVQYDVIQPVEFVVDDVIFADDDAGEPVPGAAIHADFTLTNSGRETAENVRAIFSTDSPLIVLLDPEAMITDLAAGETIAVSDVFTLILSDAIEPGIIIPCTVTIIADAGETARPVNVLVGPIFPIYSNDFEGNSDEGWTHGSSRQDQWVRGMHGENDFPRFDPKQPFSGTYMWGTRLNKSGNYGPDQETWLQSPPINCAGHSRVLLRFKRWLSVEKAIYDQTTVEVNGTPVWINPESDDWVDRQWQDVLIEIDNFLDDDRNARVMFTLASDAGVEFGGWNIDDFEILAGVGPDFEAAFENRTDGRIIMPDTAMAAGEPFTLYTEIQNYGPRRDIVEFIALEVAGMFWFWPQWTETVSYRTDTLEARSFSVETILAFPWPAVSGHAEGVSFWQAMLDAGTGTVLDYDRIIWGW
ncbi:hypothetical protein JXA80_07075 [bacterium]|nr:hypothetical protein [candidate division CSSED10-310 bacterium]